MKYILSYSLHAIGILTLIQSLKMLTYKTAARKQNLLFSAAAFASTVWSIGFSFIWIQTDPQWGRVCRAIGMVGTFFFFIFVIEILLQWIEGMEIYKNIARATTYLGVLLWPFLVGQNSVEFRTSTVMGMSYRLIPNVFNSVYNLFSVLIAVHIFVIFYLMLKHTKRKKMRVFIKYMIGCCAIVFVGMIFDTILPVFGITAFPGSTLTQGIGVLCMGATMNFKRKSELTVENISEYVYYCMDTSVLIYDDNGRLQIANNGTMDFFYGHHYELQETLLWELFPSIKENAGLHDLTVKRIVEEAECKMNHRYCQVKVNKIYDDYQDITGYIVVLNDLTEKHTLIQQLRKSEQKADSANQAKSEFLAQMSHEIRTPLSGILGLNALIQDRTTDEKIIEYANMVKISAENLLELVNDILDVSKAETEKAKIEEHCYSLQKLLWELTSITKVKIEEKGLEFQTRMIKPLYQDLYGDSKRIRQILLNIISNAVKYTKQGSVRVEFDSFWEKETYYLQFHITDTGIGIRKEDIPKIFAAFERLDQKKNRTIQGTGLGLNIVKNMVELLRGTVSVESEYGKGSSFTVTLPQKIMGEKTFDTLTPQEEIENVSLEQEITIELPEKSILVVDDNEINRIVTSELLRFTKAKVDTAESGMECLEFVKEKKYDFILLDHIMPKLDGVETMQRLKELSPEENKSKEAVLIVLTANVINGAKEEYLNKGFDDYLAKPIDLQQVEEVLEKFLPKEEEME